MPLSRASSAWQRTQLSDTIQAGDFRFHVFKNKHSKADKRRKNMECMYVCMYVPLNQPVAISPYLSIYLPF